MSAPFHYGPDYYSARRRAIGFGIPAIILTIVIIIIAGLITFYNMYCTGPSCDGSTVEYCSPASEPGFFTFVFIIMLADIGLAIMSIRNIVKAKENKIPIYYTTQELSRIVIYEDAYYKYRNAQIRFTVFAGVTGFIIFTIIAVILELIYEEMKNPYATYITTGALYYFMIVIAALSALVVLFIVLAIRNKKHKREHMVRVTESAFSETSDAGQDYGCNINTD